MKVCIIGGGGREHALAWKFARSVEERNVYVIPGSDAIANSFPVDVNNFSEVESFCREHGIDLLFVGPEKPLAEGIVDYFKDTDIAVLGPDSGAARLESSKVFAKKFMAKYGVATASFVSFDGISEGEDYISGKEEGCVIKYDGLAGGKGVYVCASVKEAQNALKDMESKYGESVSYVVEDKLAGNEVSLIGFTDGNVVKLLQTAQDHKALEEGDCGPNTGGMGAYCPVAQVSEGLMEKIRKNIIDPTLRGIKEEGFYYKGVIYFGVMVVAGEPYLLEYNVRFGDPETEVLLPALKSDITVLALACLEGKLASVEVEFNPGYFSDVVLVSGGYPGDYPKGKKISGLENVSSDALIFHAGTRKSGDDVVTNGGRVLNVVCKGETLEESLQNVYREVEKISFEGMFFRKDVGKRENKDLF